MVAIEEKIKDAISRAISTAGDALREKRRKAGAERERAQEHLAHLRSDLRVIADGNHQHEELLATYKGQLARDNRGAVLAEHSPCPICEVPLNAVLDRGCPCTADTGYLDEVRLVVREHLLKSQSLTSTVAAKKNERRGLIARVSTAHLDLETAERQKTVLSRSRIVCLPRPAMEIACWGRQRSLKRSLPSEQRRSQKAQAGKKLHEEREGQIRLIRQKNESAVRRLSQLFDAVIRELVPGEDPRERADRW